MPTTPEATPEATPAVDPRATRAVRWSIGLLAATLLLLILGPRWGLLTLGLAPATAIAMVVALVRLRGVPGAGGLRVMFGLGIGICAFALVYGIGLVIFHGPVQDLVACQDRAITETAKRQCAAEYEQASFDLLRQWGLTLP